MTHEVRASVMTTVYTVGHGTLASQSFTSLLDDARIDCVADVRSFPGSRHNPQFGRQEMERWMPGANIGYVWMPDLGGRRRPVEGSRHVALRHVSFRAYADYMETPEFLNGVEELLTLAEESSTAVMCSESVWWRCHRRLIADYLVLVRRVNVEHLMHDGRLTRHIITDGARLERGAVIYDVELTPPLCRRFNGAPHVVVTGRPHYHKYLPTPRDGEWNSLSWSFE
jgi:uncharacterized protein (DUF488 family)